MNDKIKYNLKKAVIYLKNSINITITPSPKYEIRTFKVPRFLPVLIMIVVFAALSF